MERIWKAKEIVLLTVAIVAIGIFALPSTVSLFSGQHTWYDLSAGPNDVPCEKCHGDIEDEMISGDNGAHRNLTCAMCHRTCFNMTYNPSTGKYEKSPGFIYASGKGDGSTAGMEAHAAATIECMDCHGFDHVYIPTPYWTHWNYEEYNDCNACHHDPWIGEITAGGFGMTDYPDDTGEKAAHRKFVNDSIDEPLMEGANEACIACHTRVGVNITWTKRVYLEFNASEDAAGNWTIPGFTAGGTNITQVNTSNTWTNPP
jgi:hypothetical protein